MFTHITKEGKKIEISDRSKKTIDYIEQKNNNVKENIKRQNRDIVWQEAEKKVREFKKKMAITTSVHFGYNPLAKNKVL